MAGDVSGCYPLPLPPLPVLATHRVQQVVYYTPGLVHLLTQAWTSGAAAGPGFTAGTSWHLRSCSWSSLCWLKRVCSKSRSRPETADPFTSRTLSPTFSPATPISRRQVNTEGKVWEPHMIDSSTRQSGATLCGCGAPGVHIAHVDVTPPTFVHTSRNGQTCTVDNFRFQ